MGSPRGAARAAFLELLNHAFEIGIARAKAPCEPVPTALGDFLAIGENLELTGSPRLRDRVNTKPLVDEGHETRDLGPVVQSCGAMNDLNLHVFSNRLRTILAGPMLSDARFIFLLSLPCKPA